MPEGDRGLGVFQERKEPIRVMTGESGTPAEQNKGVRVLKYRIYTQKHKQQIGREVETNSFNMRILTQNYEHSKLAIRTGLPMHAQLSPHLAFLRLRRHVLVLG